MNNYFYFFYCEDLLKQRKLESIQISCGGLLVFFLCFFLVGGGQFLLLQSYKSVNIL